MLSQSRLAYDVFRSSIKVALSGSDPMRGTLGREAWSMFSPLYKGVSGS